MSQCQRAESWEQGRALPSDVKTCSLRDARGYYCYYSVVFPLITDVWAVLKRYLLSACFSLAENRMRLQRTKSKEREGKFEPHF